MSYSAREKLNEQRINESNAQTAIVSPVKPDSLLGESTSIFYGYFSVNFPVEGLKFYNKPQSLLFVFCSYSSFSTHFMGGEITWTCIKGGPDIGKYIFQMKVYRDCNGTTFSETSQTLDHHNYPSVGTTSPILLNFISVFFEYANL